MWLSAIIINPEMPGVPLENLSNHLATYGNVIFVMPILEGRLFRTSYTSEYDASLRLSQFEASIVTCKPNSLILYSCLEIPLFDF
jgi:hypothetical protein